MSFHAKTVGPMICSFSPAAARALSAAGSAASPAIASRRVIPIALLLRQHIRCALGTRKHAVRLVVVLEALLHRIPVELALEHHGHVVNEAGGAGAMPHFHRRDWLLAADDAIQPIAVLLLAFVQVD